MARRTAAAASKTAGRESRATSVKGTEPTAAPAPGMGLGEVVAIVSTVLLLAAILMTDYYLGHKFGKGVFLNP